MLFALTSQGTVAKVEIETVLFMLPWKTGMPSLTVTELDGQQYNYEPSTRMTRHFVDVETPETVIDMEISTIDRGDTMEIKSALVLLHQDFQTSEISDVLDLKGSERHMKAKEINFL